MGAVDGGSGGGAARGCRSSCPGRDSDDMDSVAVGTDGGRGGGTGNGCFSHLMRGWEWEGKGSAGGSGRCW